MIADNDALKSKPGPPRPESKGSRCLCARHGGQASVVEKDLLIKVARQRTRGISWEVIAKDTPHSAGELCRFTVRHPDAWRPLYVRAEKLRLREAEGQTLAHLTALLKGDDEQAAEKAGRELLLHRRHIERRRNKPPRRGERQEGPASLSADMPPGIACEDRREPDSLGDLGDLGALAVEKPPPQLEIALLAAARGFALGETPGSVARETGHAAEEIARWAFIYAKAWDRAWRPARLEAAEFCAALAINRLLDFVAGPDARLAARAGRTLLIHRRHMHWARENPPQRHRDLPAVAGTEKEDLLHAARASSRTGVLLRGPKGISVPQCLCGERSWRSRDGP